MKHKIIRIFLFLLFSLFAYLQLNDPDPWLWVSGYMLIALYGLSTLILRPVKLVYMIIFGFYGLWIVAIMPEFISWLSNGAPSIIGEMQATKPHIEFAREFFGLLICIAANFYLYKSEKLLR